MSVENLCQQLGYRVEWDSETDVLRVVRTPWDSQAPTEADLNPEPQEWISRRHGIESGVIVIPKGTPDDNDNSDEDALEDRPKMVAIRMRDASKRSPLTNEQALWLSNIVGISYLNELRQGHDRLLRKIGVRPLTLLEAADKLADVVYRSQFGPSRDVEARCRAAGFDDPGDWLDAALTEWWRARSLFE